VNADWKSACAEARIASWPQLQLLAHASLRKHVATLSFEGEGVPTIPEPVHSAPTR
jgi:hypothetical protein